MKRKRFSAHPIFLLCIAVLALCDRSGVILMSLLAAFLHECGHLLGAKLLHIPLTSMRLDLLGARLEVGAHSIGYWEEWLLAASGPLVSLLAAATAYPLWKHSQYAVIFSCASLLLGFLNLLPIRTFDGGRMLEAFLNAHFSLRTVCGVLSVVSFLTLFLLWALAVYFLLLAGDGLSLFCFSIGMLMRFLEAEKE